jgi:hypothetical protein
MRIEPAPGNRSRAFQIELRMPFKMRIVARRSGGSIRKPSLFATADGAALRTAYNQELMLFLFRSMLRAPISHRIEHHVAERTRAVWR